MKRNKFNLSHYKPFTCDMGNLIPISWYETIPGDTVQQRTSILVRVSPLLAPLMHPIIVRINSFFVPNRLIWEDWEDFITGGEDGTSTPTHPYKSFASVSESSLRDYLGLKTGTYNIDVNALPFRAYQLIWNEYFRDQDLCTEATLDTSSGSDSTTPSSLQQVCWEKDYFTTCRTDTDKGPAVTVPLSGVTPIKGIGKANATWKTGPATSYEADQAGHTYDEYTEGDNADISNRMFIENDGSDYPGIYANFDSDASVNTAHIDINALRLSLGLQRFQEARQQYGSRYVEYLRYLGVKSSDARLQNPEYLGGGRQTISFSEVLSTDGSNTGSMKGHGIAALRTRRFRRFFEEHGIVMTTMSVIPKAMYADALNRAFLRTTKEDYFNRELQFIGEQEITNQEVMADHGTPTGVFGYQSRYDEYRSGPHSQISGEFRSTLDEWTAARIYGSDPSLNSTFVQATPTKRYLASSGTDALYCMANMSVQARRPISPKGTPRLIG